MKHSYVILYKMPTTDTIRTVKDQGKAVPFYPLNDNVIGTVITLEEDELKDGQFMKVAVPRLELVWDLQTVVFDYVDYMKMTEDPDHVPTPLKLYEEDTSEDSSGST